MGHYPSPELTHLQPQSVAFPLQVHPYKVRKPQTEKSALCLLSTLHDLGVHAPAGNPAARAPGVFLHAPVHRERQRASVWFSLPAGKGTGTGGDVDHNLVVGPGVPSTLLQPNIPSSLFSCQKTLGLQDLQSSIRLPPAVWEASSGK